MKSFKKKQEIEVEIYQTSDGKEWTNKTDAQLHEDKLKGLKKTCPKCNGKKYVNERFEKEWHNTDLIPTKGEYVEVRKKDECPECKGKGFLELKWS